MRVRVGVGELRTSHFWRDVLVEVLATFMLMAAQASLPLKWENGSGFGGIVQVGIGMGFVVAIMVEVLGPYGGAHMNPAVSLSMMLARKISPVRCLLYIIAQNLGALGGAGLLYGLTPPQYRDSLAATTLGPGVTVVQGLFIEVWLTFQLLMTIHGATDEKVKPVFMPCIPIGMAVTLGVISGSKHTGASMNPARSLGPAVVMNIWDHHWIYWVGPLLGATLAAAIRVYIIPAIPNKEDNFELPQLSNSKELSNSKDFSSNHGNSKDSGLGSNSTSITTIDMSPDHEQRF